MATIAAVVVPTPQLHVVECLDADVAALRRFLAEHPLPKAPDGDGNLDLPVSKPWGYEMRIFEDAISEAWLLALNRGRETSLHAHLRKVTALVCVGGEGWLTTGGERRIELVPGTAVVIMPGARHRSWTATGMWLVELETPKDKGDLVRYEDRERASGSPYEQGSAAHLGGVEAAPLVSVPAGPSPTRVRGADRHGLFRFDVEAGADVKAHPENLCAAIAVDLRPILRRELSVVTADGVDRARDDDAHLTVRRVVADGRRRHPERGAPPPRT